MSATLSLKRVPLFSHLADPDLARVGEVTRERQYPKNSVILFEDDPGDALYVVLSGKVKVVLIGEDGREVILSVLKESDFFGEMSLIDEEPRSAHVIALEDANLLVLRREDFWRCIESNPSIAFGLLRQLSLRLRHANHQIGSLVLLDVTGRVARLLLELADKHDGLSVPRTVTHHQIAQMIGSSRETVSRTIRELSDRGHIEVSKQNIVIRDRQALRTAAGMA